MSTDPHRPVVLVSVTSEAEAVAIVTALSIHGIQARSTGGYTAAFRAEAPGGLTVLVRYEDLHAAREILAQIVRDEMPNDSSRGSPDREAPDV